MAISFNIPKDYNVPSGVKEGVEFSDVATFKFDGKEMMILSVGEDKTPILNKEEKESKPKGAKAAIKEQLASMEDKSGNEKMEDTEGSEDVD
jgi:amino acid permease